MPRSRRPRTQIERRRLFGQQHRIVARRHHGGRAKPQRRRAHRQRGLEHQRRGHLVPAAEMVLDRKARMEAERFGFDIEVEIVKKATAGLWTEARNIGFGRTEQTETHY
jgi:hypothetical protein